METYGMPFWMVYDALTNVLNYEDTLDHLDCTREWLDEHPFELVANYIDMKGEVTFARARQIPITPCLN